jgi:hypothetical protein
MEIIISDKAKELSLLTQVCVERSREKWAAGLRSDPQIATGPMMDYGKEQCGDAPFLWSSYLGGEVVTLTSEDRMRVMVVTELPDAVRQSVLGNHHRIAKPFCAVI